MAIRGSNFFKTNSSAFDSGLNVLFLAAFPLILWLFQGDPVAIVTAVVQMGLFATALRLISRGQKIHQEYNAAQVANRPRFPRKTVGSALIGLMVMILAAHHYHTIAFPLMLGLFGFGLSLTAFGIDPTKDKGMDDPLILERIRMETYVVNTQEELVDLSERIAALGDAELAVQTDAASDLGIRLLKAFSADTDELKRFRKPMKKFIEIFSAEVSRLEDAWDTEDFLFARRRYAAKMQVLAESFEERARRGGVKSGRDAFDMEADLLLGRMPQESAA